MEMNNYQRAVLLNKKWIKMFQVSIVCKILNKDFLGGGWGNTYIVITAAKAVRTAAATTTAAILFNSIFFFIRISFRSYSFPYHAYIIRREPAPVSIARAIPPSTIISAKNFNDVATRKT
jgi:uncharacterized membrane protein YjjP (DUF1212 family)